MVDGQSGTRHLGPAVAAGVAVTAQHLETETTRHGHYPGAALVADVEADALRWAEALRLAAFYRAIDQGVIDDQVDTFDKAWNVWHTTQTKQKVPRSTDWRQSIERFLALGLSTDELTRLVRVSMGNEKVRPDETWRYFCGCCWRSVTELQETARLILEDGNG